MSGLPSNDPCRLRCRWHGTEMCIRCLLSPEAVAEHHLSLGVSCGLRHVYYEHGLPPCLHSNGDVDWHYADLAEDLLSEEEALAGSLTAAPASVAEAFPEGYACHRGGSSLQLQ